MARLPVPGSDDYIWAELLNEFLLVSHNDDGTQRKESIPTRSVEMRDLDVKNNDDQDVTNLILTNEDKRLVWKDGRQVLRANSKLTVNVADYGAKGDGTTDDTVAIQTAINAVENGGVVEIPRGTYMVSGLKVKRHGVTIRGEARYGTRLARIKGSTAPLLDLSGEYSLDGHLKFCSVESMTMSGEYEAGLLIRSYFADNFIFRDMNFRYCNGVALDFVEVWDTRFNNCSWEGCGNNSEPAVLLRNSMPEGQFGYGNDNTNQIHFTGCRWESFYNGAIRLDGAANGSPHLLNGIFFVSCKMETRHASGSAFQIMSGTTLVYVIQLYVAIMAAEPDQVKPLDVVEDWGSHIFMTDVYVQWGQEVNLANSLAHIYRSGPHMYYKLSTYYPNQDPVEATIIAEPDSFEVHISAHVTNRGKKTKGNVKEIMVMSQKDGTRFALDKTGSVGFYDLQSGNDLTKLTNDFNRPAYMYAHGTDIAGFSDDYNTEKWRLVSSTGSARFASGKFQVDGAKGHVGINTVPVSNIAMLIKPAQEGDKGLTVVRPTSASTLRLMEFQDETYNIQGMAIDSNGRPIAVGKPPVVTKGDQVSYANPQPQVRDIAGSIVAAVKPSPTAAGTIATVTFSRPFASVPLFIDVADHSAVDADLYVSARSASSFTISTRKAIPGGSILTINYSVIG